MKTEIRIDASVTEPYALIFADKVTDEIAELVEMISADRSMPIMGFRDGAAAILEPAEIIRIYSANQRVYAVTRKGEFTLKSRLYEMEKRLESCRFARISSSELINLREAESFDLNLAGTIRVRMKNGDSSYVSRRFVAKIKGILGI